MKLTKNQPVEYQLQSGGWKAAKVLKNCTVNEQKEDARVMIETESGIQMNVLFSKVKILKSATYKVSTEATETK